MSLPIEIFGTDSNLERLAKAYYYAPRFLEEAALIDYTKAGIVNESIGL